MTHEAANVSGASAPTTFVLVPGAGADPRVYGATIEALRALGHEGIAPSLPLDRPEATPSDHADAIIAALPDPRPRPVAMVGQSLGAFAATIAAARLRASRLVLLAPMIPAPGESAGEWWQSTGHPEAIADLTERLGEMSEWDGAALAEVFLHDVDEETAAASAKYDGAPGAGLFAEPLPLDTWPDVPTTVIAPREDRLFPLSFQRRIARERLGLVPVEIDGGHLSYLSRPRELAAVLVGAARG